MNANAFHTLMPREIDVCEDIPPSSCFFPSTTAPSFFFPRPLPLPLLSSGERERAATAVPSLVSPPSRLRERLCVLPHNVVKQSHDRCRQRFYLVTAGFLKLPRSLLRLIRPKNCCIPRSYHGQYVGRPGTLYLSCKSILSRRNVTVSQRP